MDEMLLLRDRIMHTIELGESHFREFKTALEGKPDNKRSRLVKHICADIGEALVAFANADGGDLLIGVEDNGEITGLAHSEPDIAIMLDAVHTHVFHGQELPLTAARVIKIDSKRILYFSVFKGSTRVYQLPDGRCVKRKDKATIPELVDNIQFERQEIRSREFDSQFVDEATVSDLNLDLLKSIANEYIKGLSAEMYLQQLKIAEYAQSGLRLRRAALLLFAKDIDRWHSRSQVRFIQVDGTEIRPVPNYNVRNDEVAKGNIFELIYNSWERLRPYLAYKTEFGLESKFQQQFTYPEEACREALLNAIAHRDYSIQNGIEVFIYTDRMEIKSPGALLSTLSVNNLYKQEGSHESRNPNIAKVLRENRLMRELGEGMKRIFELMNSQELEEPKLYSNGQWFSVSLLNRTVYSQQDLNWLLLFGKYTLTKNQKQIVLLGKNGTEFSTSDAMKAINTTDVDHFMREITLLRKMKIVAPTKSRSDIDDIYRRMRMPKDRKNIPRYKILQA